MTVKQLIEKLSKLDGNLKVVTPTNDEGAAELSTEVEIGEYSSMLRGFEPYEGEDATPDMKVNAVRIR